MYLYTIYMYLYKYNIYISIYVCVCVCVSTLACLKAQSFKNLFIYLAAPGLSCSMQDL